jgi:hypothetical protein
MHFHLLVTSAEPEPEKWLDYKSKKHVISITEHLIFAHHSVTIHVFSSSYSKENTRTFHTDSSQCKQQFKQSTFVTFQIPYKQIAHKTSEIKVIPKLINTLRTIVYAYPSVSK